ncbi:MAG: TIM barrel protein [Quadrisphaera sp.]
MSTVSTWSLHRTLGTFAVADGAPGQRSAPPPHPQVGGTCLLDLPPLLAEHGFTSVQICHFHLASRDRGYLLDVAAAFNASGIGIEALLIDDGDLLDDAHSHATSRWMLQWTEAAGHLGATRARVIAGRQPPSAQTLRTSAARLQEIAGASPVRVVTENWLELLPTAADTLRLLEEVGDGVGLLMDLGNWEGPDKHAELGLIASRAESCHAKCHTRPGSTELDLHDFRASVAAATEGGYAGPWALVYDGRDTDEWKNLGTIRAALAEGAEASQ